MFTIAGVLLLVLASIGIFIPILPTTPFVIGAAGCFSFTPKLHKWIMGNSFFSEYIENYVNKKGLKPTTIFKSLALLWIMLIFSMIRMGKVWGYVLLIAVGIGVTIHLWWISKDRSKNKSDKI